MKIHHIILTAALVILFGGCEQKNPAQTEAPATPGQKAQQAGAKVKEVNKEPAKADKAQSPKVESSDNISPAVAKVSTEQSLADISKHGREVTRTQESKSRTRAQMAEDEMQKDLENFKR
jgi:hypothetical protein